MRAASGLVGLVAIVCAGLASCAAPSAPQRAQTAPAPEAAPSPREIAHDDIRQYWGEIRAWRVEQGWAPEPAAGRPLNGAAPAPMCTGNCGDICNIADAICQNKDRICEIAGQLPGDTWARDKCESAKRSCEEAREACECCTEAAENATELPQPCSP